MADKVRERATAQLSTQKDKATEGLGGVAQAVRQTTEHLRSNQHETVARYAEQAADQIERFSQRLKDKDVSELLNDAQRLARRKPALFVGGAFAIGLLGARFLKSSAGAERNESQGFSSGGEVRQRYGAGVAASNMASDRTSGTSSGATARSTPTAGADYDSTGASGAGSPGSSRGQRSTTGTSAGRQRSTSVRTDTEGS